MKSLPIVSILTICFVSLVTQSISSVMMAIIIMIAGLLACKTVGDSKSREYAFGVFNIAFIFTTLFILFRYGYLMDVPDTSNIFKSGGDEHRFYEIADDAKYYTRISNIFTDVFYFEFAENQGYIFYLRFLSFLGYKLFDGNHIVLQMMGSSLFGCLLAVVLYKMLNLYFDEKKSFRYTIVGFFLSPFFYYSVMLLRDIHVAMVFAVMSYIVLKPFNTMRFVWLMLLVVLAFFLRMESGILAVMFPLLFYFLHSKNKAVTIVVLAVIVVGFVFYTGIGSELLITVTDTNEYYVDRTESMSSSAMMSLPHPIREIAIFIVNNFFGAAATWSEYKNVEAFFPFVLTSLGIAHRAFWLVLFIVSFKWLFIDRKIVKMNQTLQWLFIVAMVVELANSSQIETRRVMCVYPILLLIFFVLKEQFVSVKTRRTDYTVSLFYYFFISMIYTFIP